MLVIHGDDPRSRTQMYPKAATTFQQCEVYIQPIGKGG
jgi:hypothetical protein